MQKILVEIRNGHEEISDLSKEIEKSAAQHSSMYSDSVRVGVEIRV